ncbi:MAG TPA: mercury methylation corrinoid protein HgcA [Anaeromyxobacteraceae bacterium]|nr:mercury methylation corrinoid protein HgcA [Anaeromyxobacteraceae bacterium]
MTGGGCGCTAEPAPRCVDGAVESGAGQVPRISTRWTWRDRLEHLRCRLGSFRNRYRRPPGLYAVGRPGRDTDVVVTANYGLSFDVVRRALRDLDAWLLVLDTRGVNVWCAAGKGTFGSTELIRRVEATSLGKVVAHRRLVVPQLGAPGVAAHEVQAATGFRVHFGPVRADDLPAWLRAGRVASPAMRRVRFGILDRAILVPMELLPALRWFAAIAAVALLAPLALGLGAADAGARAAPFLALLLAAVLAGAIVAPLALPVLPGRAFSVKGLVAGVPITAAALALAGPAARAPLLALAAMLGFPAVSSWLTLQFTGSSPFTGLSGVRREMRLAVPLQAAAVLLAALLAAAHALGERGAP